MYACGLRTSEAATLEIGAIDGHNLLLRIIGNAPPYVLIGKPGLKSITDLKGKTVSVGQVKDITTVYFDRMLAANGLKREDCDVISAGVAAASSANGTPGADFETRRTSADLTWATLGAAVRRALRKR